MIWFTAFIYIMGMIVLFIHGDRCPYWPIAILLWPFVPIVYLVIICIASLFKAARIRNNKKRNKERQ